ncbi:G-protein coupled receptor 84-like [Chiloscyllium plagiosum]|uniref:G-protein coupled receptor 84-like n=1 Tax=Chiloscyllium plagiosum TaxID=36176 RepID=UPI001CB889CD|nr:G-protein coupled receptor 84-like [Chiloscyllium plagiosum]
MFPGVSCLWEPANASNWSCDPSLSEYRYFGASLGLLVTAVGATGNTLTLLAYAVDPRLRSRFNLLILNLTLSDLLYSAFLQPVTVASYLRAGWTGGPDSCRAFGLLVFTSNLVSILNLALIAGARYALVKCPRGFREVSGRPWAPPVFLGAPWLISFGLLAPFWCVYDFLPSVCSCSLHPTRGRAYTTALHVLTFGLGLASIGVFYLLIYRKVRSTGRAARSYRVPRPAEASSSRPEGQEEEEEVDGGTQGEEGSEATGSARRSEGQPMARRKPRARRRGSSPDARRVTAMCFAVFLVYLACYLPFCLANLFRRGLPAIVRTLAGNITWLNSCANPVLYAVMNRQFRDAYGRVLRLPCSLCASRGQRGLR